MSDTLLDDLLKVEKYWEHITGGRKMTHDERTLYLLGRIDQMRQLMDSAMFMALQKQGKTQVQ